MRILRTMTGGFSSIEAKSDIYFYPVCMYYFVVFKLSHCSAVWNKK